MSSQHINTEALRFKRAAFYNGLKSKVGLAAAKAAALRVNLMMIILLLFLQKQNLAFTVYLFGSVLSSKRLFRGPSTNDMKK